MAEDSPHIAMQCITASYVCSLGVLAAVDVSDTIIEADYMNPSINVTTETINQPHNYPAD